MTVDEFRQTLARHPKHGVRFVIANGGSIADHFHVTEVGRVEKQFVNCGGERRSSVACVLQTLVANDTDHRLSTDKLLKIIAIAKSLDLAGDSPVEVEHQERSVCVDAIADGSARDGVLEFRLTAKQTACLAEDACGIGLTPGGTVQLDVVDGDCCGASGCC